MYQPKKINIGDRVTLKKNHPCGGNQFVITRVGMDFRMKCQTCQKEIWIERPELERRIKVLIILFFVLLLFQSVFYSLMLFLFE